MTSRLIELRAGVLSKNDHLAAALRERFQGAGLLALNLVSGPGTGKTALLERTMGALIAGGSRPAALVGDLATDNDARRLARSGAPVRQIETGGLCHLEAQLVEGQLAAAGWALEQLDYLFIENVGNLVCPASYDLGEGLRVALVSAAEGEDKPLKYPAMFSSADAAVITKLDLAEPCELDLMLMRRNLHQVRPGITILETSARTGAGMGPWLAWLAEQRARASVRAGRET